MMVVRLSMVRPLATSTVGLNRDASNSLGDGDILVKESICDVNVWDNEW